MAEGALFHLAGKALSALGSLASSYALQEAKLASGVKTEIENLTDTVSTIQAVILDAEKKSSHSHQIKDWLRKLKDVLHDADDLLDDFSFEVLRHKVMTKKQVRLFSSSSNQLAFSPKMVHKIEAIRKRLNAIADGRKFHLDESSIEPQVMNRDRETYSFVHEEDVIGREDDKKEITKLLLDDNVVENISIIPIVGLGGLGKTTLAQLVYNDKNVSKNFELKLWICISDIFDVTRIVKEILKQLKKKKHEGSLESLKQLKKKKQEGSLEILEKLTEHAESLEMLQNELREELNGKKYFLVLDDLWNENNNKWLHLRDLLMVGARGSRIIVTTRSERVARITGATSWHALKGLSVEKAWSLFVKMAFEQGQLPENQAFISLGKEIVEKCGGVPLAIRTIASLLYTKTSETEWRSFKNYELSKIGQEEENDISSTLKLSYNHLPSHLKQCFAYCRLFPKDYKIQVRTVIHLWAAQGFIKLSNPKQCVEDVGREYFMALLWRSFFQDVEKDELGNIACCKMHDLMHDFATLVAGTESTMVTSSEENIGEKTRHVSFGPEHSSRQLPIPIVKGMKIRSVLAASVGGELGKLTFGVLVSNLKFLRTLDLSKLELRVVPRSIGKLKHLRYLDISENTDIKFLPNSITKLLNLQTLKLSGCGSLRELPRDIKKLLNLRHLDISGCFRLTHMPLGLGHLTSLEILPEFVVGSETSLGILPPLFVGWFKKRSGGLSELKELSNLGGSLNIKWLGHGKDDMVECKATNMKEKQHLQRLKLQWEWMPNRETECYDEESLEGLQPHPNLKALELLLYMGVRIPNWLSSVTNLVELRFANNRRLKHLPPLNKLPYLKFLKMEDMGALEYISEEEEDSVSNVFGGSSSSSSKTIEFFPSLSSLVIYNCPNLKGWWRKDYDNEPDHLLLPSFPCLSILVIRSCPKLTSMPPFLYLKEKLQLDKTSSKVLQQTMKMGTRQRASTATTSTSTSSSSCFPLSQLQSLDLEQVSDLESLPEEWLGNLTSLQRLGIRVCPNITSLPLINKLPYLKSLDIWGMKALEYISEEEEDSVSNVFGGSSSSSSKTIEFFPSLSSLVIYNCPNLKGWWRKDYDNEPDHLLLPSFPCLSRLVIRSCPKLTAMPPFPYLKERLELWGVSSKVLQQTMKMGTRQRASTATTSTSTSSSSCFPLSQLQYLKLVDVKDLESLPEEWLGNLTSLQRLEIRDCPHLGRRCQRQTGEDWPNIAHVPFVMVDGEYQHQETIPSSSDSESESVCLHFKWRT